MKIYEIEESNKDHYGAVQYRFFSLYNGTRGAWTYNKYKAEKQGQKHQEIIEMIHNGNPMFILNSEDTK